jgi:hypothetical protein
MGNAGTTKSQSPEKSEERSQDRISEATSEKTVSDLEESEKISDSNPVDQRSIPAPDGSPDPDQGSRNVDGSDAGDPM